MIHPTIIGPFQPAHDLRVYNVPYMHAVVEGFKW